jgi:hypothetical protein
MAQRKSATGSEHPRRDRGDKLKDEVYRQMFRLEANRPGADLDLAIALLRGWLAPCSEPEHAKLCEWLEKVCPICLLMIEAAQQKDGTGQQFVRRMPKNILG